MSSFSFPLLASLTSYSFFASPPANFLPVPLRWESQQSAFHGTHETLYSRAVCRVKFCFCLSVCLYLFIWLSITSEWQQLCKYKSQNKEDAFSLLGKPIPKVWKARICQRNVKRCINEGHFCKLCIKVLAMCMKLLHQQEQKTLLE
jgi:hypothetical protein